MNDKTDFKMIPDTEDLESIPRELRFFPADPSSCTTLDADDVRTFNEQGFLNGIRVFSDAEIAGVRSYFDELLKRVLAEGGDSYSISSAHLRHGRVYDLLRHPQVVAIARDLLGPNVVGWGSHFFCKMPRDGRSVAWHQDASYWPLTPSRTVTVWLAIDDADVENACMQFISGSHRHGHIAFRQSDESEGNVLDQAIDDAEQYGSVVDNILKAGEISVHNDLLLHGSQANASSRRRCGLTLRYCDAGVRAHMDWNQKGVVVAGSDGTGHWSNRSRPDAD